jgi:DNA-binding transcriptional regulator YiaG
MSDPRITDEATEAAAHSLRQFDAEGQWEPGELGLLLAYRDAARSALEAAVPLLAPQPAVDREALIKTIDKAGALEVGGTLWPLDRKNVREIADAVLALINGSEESAPEESLGSTLRRLRERADLSQEELAAKAQVSRASIQNWEADRRAPRRAESRRLAAALGVSGVTPHELGKNDKS